MGSKDFSHTPPKVPIEKIALDNILRVLENVTFGKDTSAMIVGGRKRLEDLIASGRIAAVKPTARQNGKWFCNAADVLRHCRKFK